MTRWCEYHKEKFYTKKYIENKIKISFIWRTRNLFYHNKIQNKCDLSVDKYEDYEMITLL